MRFHKAELFFFLLVCFILLNGIVAWMCYLHLSNNMDADALLRARNYSYLAVVLSVISMTSGLLLIYPAMSRGLRERGQFQKMSEKLSMQSLSLEQAAITDALTGMYNRRYFDKALGEYLDIFGKIDRPVGLAILDLDHFKKINDTFGHDVGDEVLRKVSQCICSYIRSHDVVARLGGEEFVILAPNTNQEQLKKLSERIREAVSTTMARSGNKTLKVTISIGIAIWDQCESGQMLYRRADQHLYAAKNSGRNCVYAA